MNILVTGGAGFLGANLCQRLLNEGHQVTCLDNFFTSARCNIDHLRGRKGFTLVEHDVIMPLPAVDTPERIYHLACPASPPHYQDDPVYTARIAFEGTLRMLNFARKTGARMMQASTSEVYGDPDAGHHPQKESYRGNVNPHGIRACYDEGKRIGETLCFDFIRRENTDVRVVRIFNTYGPQMHPHDGRVVSNFILQALQGKDITLYGDGLQTRSFCFVDDLIEAFVRMVERPTPAGQQPFYGPVNTGNPVEFTIAQLADLVIELTGSKSKKVFLPLPKDDPLQRKPDITLASEKLGWEPEIALREGLQKTIPYFAGLDLSQFIAPTMHTAHASCNLAV